MLITGEEMTASIRAEGATLEQIASLIYEIYGRLELLEGDLPQIEIDLRIGLVYDRWTQLDELGVVLPLPDLKSLVAAHVANHPSPGEADRVDEHAPASPGQTPSGEDARSTPAGGRPRVDTSAAPLPFPLGPDEEAP